MRNMDPLERRATRLEDARFQTGQSRSAATDLVCSQWNERERVRIAERRTQRTVDLNGLVFRYNPVMIIVHVAMLSDESCLYLLPGFKVQ